MSDNSNDPDRESRTDQDDSAESPIPSISRRQFGVAATLGGLGLAGLSSGAAGDGEASLQAGGLSANLTDQKTRSQYVTAPASAFDPSALNENELYWLQDGEVGVKTSDGTDQLPMGSSTNPVPEVNTESALIGGEGPIEGVDPAALDSNNRIVGGGGGAEQLVSDTTNDEYLTVVRGSTDYYYGNVDPSTVSGEDVGPYDYYASVDETADGWVQTENSPYAGTGSQSHVINIPNEWDKLEISFSRCENTSGGSQGLYMRINEVVGDGTNLEYYYELLTDNTTNDQATDFTLVSSIGDGKGVQPSIELSGVNSTAGTIQAYGPSGEGSGNAGLLTGTFDNNPESGVNSIEIRGGSGTIAVEAMVRGWTL